MVAMVFRGVQNKENQYASGGQHGREVAFGLPTLRRGRFRFLVERRGSGPMATLKVGHQIEGMEQAIEHLETGRCGHMNQHVADDENGPRELLPSLDLGIPANRYSSADLISLPFHPEIIYLNQRW